MRLLQVWNLLVQAVSQNLVPVSNQSNIKKIPFNYTIGNKKTKNICFKKTKDPKETTLER